MDSASDDDDGLDNELEPLPEADDDTYSEDDEDVTATGSGAAPPAATWLAECLAQQEEEMRTRNAQLDREKEAVLKSAEVNLRSAAFATDATASSAPQPDQPGQPRGYRGATAGSSGPASVSRRPPSAGRPLSAGRGAARAASARGASGVTVSEARLTGLEDQLRQMGTELHNSEQTIKRLNAEKQV